MQSAIYFAFIRGREGEIQALQRLSPFARARMAGVADMPTEKPGSYRAIEVHINCFATNVIKAWGTDAPVYLDMTRHVDDHAIDPAAARKDAHEIDLAAAELRKIAPNSGSYVLESNYFNRSWQNEYSGKNYSRLRAIKTKYDPDGFFIVHHGVGSEDWSADGFTRT